MARALEDTALSGGDAPESDASESGWHKLSENEGDVGYFLVKFGVELRGGGIFKY